MSGPLGERQDRAVRLATVDGDVVGKLRLSELLRTLDGLNVVSKYFVAVHDAELSATGWSFEGGMLAINKNAILFATEITAFEPPKEQRHGDYTRRAVRIQVATFQVEGFVHVAHGGSALARLNQDTHPFIAITSASVAGPGAPFGTPFLAVHRRHIQAVQELRGELGEPVSAGAAGTATAPGE